LLSISSALKRQIVDTFFPRRCGNAATLSFDQFVCACATVLEPQFIFTKTMEYHGLNHSALGQIKYKEFEFRLSAADLEGRLSIREWLGKDVPSRIGTRLCAEPGAHAIHHK
ncbi:Hypothetical predicted protein, partial [Drosophila guanche]